MVHTAQEKLQNTCASLPTLSCTVQGATRPPFQRKTATSRSGKTSHNSVYFADTPYIWAWLRENGAAHILPVSEPGQALTQNLVIWSLISSFLCHLLRISTSIRPYSVHLNQVFIFCRLFFAIIHTDINHFLHVRQYQPFSACTTIH